MSSSSPSPVRSELHRVLAQNMLRLRAEQRWSTRAFAEHSKLSESYLFELETERRKNASLDILDKVARGFGVPASCLLNPSGERCGAETLQSCREVLAANLKGVRTKRAVTQAALAEEAGLARTVISGLENGKLNVSIGVLARLSEVFDIPAHELVWSR